MVKSSSNSAQFGVRVKICGLTTAADALAAAAAGADFLGYVFYSGSKRHITPQDAAPIIAQVRASHPTVGHVGLIVDLDPAGAVDALTRSGADFAQLHGDHAPTVAASIRRCLPAIKIITAFRFGHDAPPAPWQDAETDFYLCDTYDPAQHGGTGRRFDPALIPAAMPRRRLFLAGGLTPATVADAVRAVRPFAVDVSSGVESSPGRKDPSRIEAFIAAVHAVS
jgi:phosphoribosylanthranilate isomerase